jgi:AbrB family looped-hinge helix DNA binding protein
MMITSKGQITIPKEYREKLGLLPHTEVEFELVGEELRLKKVQTPSGRGQRLIAHMTGKSTVQMTTDEIMHLTRGE